MKPTLWLAGVFLVPLTVGHAAEFHVATHGEDTNHGTHASPLRTIQRAAELAQPGDVITVHAGTYRERVNPPRGGTSEANRIVYRAARGEQVEVKGSEVVKGWSRVQEGVWKVTLPASLFGAFNPFSDRIHGDWFDPRGREHHTGAVYLDGDWLIEAATLEEVLLPGGGKPAWWAKLDAREQHGLWFAQVTGGDTTLWAQFGGIDPNAALVEVNVRQTVFYPDQPGRNFITVRGFVLRHAATPWAPPTAEQIGLIGTHWSRGWIIENNLISHSVCSGIALGKHGDAFDNTSANTAEGYVKTIERAHAHPIPWSEQTIGHHVVRGNTIAHCEQAGVVGSLGCSFSTVTGNTIHDIHVRRLFSGAEMAGIKFHAAIDVVLSENHISRTCRGLWLDWMAQGTRVSRNLFHDNLAEDLFVEVNHGPFVVDNNVFLSNVSLLDMSEGGAYAHNLFAGRLTNRPEPSRETPYHPPHSTTVAGLAATTGGDNRFYNNLFVGQGEALTADRKGNLKELRWISSDGLWGYDGRELPSFTGGNVYCFGAEPYALEQRPVVLPGFNPGLELIEERGQVYLYGTWCPELSEALTVRVDTRLLGEAKIPRLPYVGADGALVAIDRDYLGRRRSATQPAPGPFERPGAGSVMIRLR